MSIYEAIENELNTLGIIKFIRYKLANRSKLANRIWLDIMIWRYRRIDSLLKYMVEKSQNGNIIYDIGAHEGIYSFVLAQLIPNSVVYAFEPNPYVYPLLENNIKIRKMEKRIIPLKFALSSKNEVVNFFVSSTLGRSSLHSYDAARDSKIIETIQVECFSMDYLIKNDICKPPNIIKMDTEGHESEIILGARDTIQTFKPAIGFEAHGTEDEFATTLETIDKFLKANGYTFKRLGYPLWYQVNDSPLEKNALDNAICNIE